MFRSLLSYVQIRVSVILSLGYRFSLPGPRSLGVALEVGRLVFLYPAMIPLPVVEGLCPGFFLPWGWRTWTNQSLVCISIFFVLVIVEPRACQSLGVAWFIDPCGICYHPLWFGSVSLSLDLGFEFRPPLVLVIDFWFGIPVSLGVCSWFDLMSSRSLSLYRLGEPYWITDSWLGFC